MALLQISSLLHGLAAGVKGSGLNASALVYFRQGYFSDTKNSSSAIFSSFVRLPSFTDPWASFGDPLPWSDELELHFGVVSNKTYGLTKDSILFRHNVSLSSSWDSQFATVHSGSRVDECVIATAQNYKCGKFAPFLRSLRAAGSCARVIIFRSDALALPCAELLESCGSVEFVSTRAYDDTLNADVARYVIALDFLTNATGTGQSCKHVVFVDFADVLFQRDPFRYKALTENVVVLSEEGNNDHTRVMIGKQGCNTNWINTVCTQLIGRECDKSVSQMPVINSGVLFGDRPSMIKLLHIFAFVLSRTHLGWFRACWKTSLSGQGILNFIVYMGLIRGIVDIVVLPGPLSFFAHTVFQPVPLLNASAPYHPATNPLVNAEGVPLAIIHQYNHPRTQLKMSPWLGHFLESMLPNCTTLELCTPGSNNNTYNNVHRIIELSNPLIGQQQQGITFLKPSFLRDTPSSRFLRVAARPGPGPDDPQFLYYERGHLHRVDNASTIDCLASFPNDVQTMILAHLRVPLDILILDDDFPDICTRSFPARLHNAKNVWHIHNGTKSAFRSANELFSKGYSFDNVEIVHEWLLAMLPEK